MTFISGGLFLLVCDDSELGIIEIKNEKHFIGICPLYNLYITKKKKNMYKNVNIPNFTAVTASVKGISLMKIEVKL